MAELTEGQIKAAILEAKRNFDSRFSKYAVELEGEMKESDATALRFIARPDHPEEGVFSRLEEETHKGNAFLDAVDTEIDGLDIVGSSKVGRIAIGVLNDMKEDLSRAISRER